MNRSRHRPGAAAAALMLAAAAAVGMPTTKALGQTLEVNQLDYYLDGFLHTSNSRHGELSISYAPFPTPMYLNVVDTSSLRGDGTWIVQNHPLLTPKQLGSTTFTSSVDFNLGVLDGTDVSSLPVLYSITSTPLLTQPVTGITNTFSVGTSQAITNSGVPSLINFVQPAGPFQIPLPLGLPTITWHPGMTNVVQEKNFCGPGAAANSLGWLASVNNFDLPGTKADAMNEMAPAMGNNNDGNWDGEEMEGKLKFINDHDLPLEVHYTGGVTAPHGAGSGNYMSPNGQGSARNDGPVTWEWIEKEMAKGQDVEIMTNTHWVVVEGTISNGGNHTIIYRDDPYQHGGATTPAEQMKIDERHKSSPFKDGKVNIGNGEEVLMAAVAESPVEVLTCSEWDPLGLNNSITGGIGVWDTTSLNFRANRTDAAALNRVWNNNIAAFGGGGTNVVTINTGGVSVCANAIFSYSPTTINGGPAEGIALQDQARITALAPLTINAPLMGMNGFSVNGGNATTPLTLSAASSITGRALLESNTINLRDNGSVLGISDIYINPGVSLVLNNNTAGTNPSINLPDDGINTFGRISNDGVVHMQGGFMIIQPPAVGGGNSTERFGELEVKVSASELHFQTDGPIICQALFQRLAPRPPFSGATLDITYSGGILGTNPQVIFQEAPPLTNNILPFVTVQGADFATHSGNGTSLRAYTPTVAETGNINSLAPNNNAKPAVSQNLVNNLTINSLNLPNNVNVITGPFNLNLVSGGLLLGQGNHQIQGNGRLTAGGTVPIELQMLSLVSTTTLINVPVTDNAGPNLIFGDSDDGRVTLVKSGRGDVFLTAPNQYTGSTIVNSGVLHITSNQNLGSPAANASVELIGPSFFGPGSEPFTGILAVEATMTTNRPISMRGGAIRIADNQTVFLGPNTLTPVAESPRRVVFMSPAGSPGSPAQNGRVNLGASQVHLTGLDTLAIGDVVLEIQSPQALGNATIEAFSGNRAGENNNVTMIKAPGSMTLGNDMVMPPGAYDRLYIDGSGGVITLTGHMKRANYNASYGQLANSNNTTLIIGPGGQFNGGCGIAAVSGDVSILRVNAWGGMLDNRNQNFLGVLSGPRAEPDQLGRASGESVGKFSWSSDLGTRTRGAAGPITAAYSVLASEAKAWNGGISRPLPFDLPAGVTVAFTGNASGGVVLNALDDVVKSGPGSLLFLYSGNTGAGQFATRGNNSLIDIQAGNWIVKDVANSSDAFAPIISDATTGVTDLIFDGGHDVTAPVPGNGVVNYQIRDTGTLVAKFGNNDGPGGLPDGGSGHTMHFNLTLNPGGSPLSVATIQVGDLAGPGSQARLPMTIGNAPLSALPTPTTTWTGELRKTGLGQLVLSRSRLAAISPGASLKIAHGTVTVDAVGANDPLSGGASPVAVEINTGSTLQIAGGSSTVRSVGGDPGELRIDSGGTLHLAPGTATASNVASLTISGSTNAWTGQLEMADNALVIDYDSPNPSPLTTVANQLQQGYASGAWNGNGITSSSTNLLTPQFALGYAEASSVFTFPTAYRGVSLDMTSVVIGFTRYGDANLDGTVGLNDFNRLAAGFGIGTFWFQGDFNYDNMVNLNDFNLLAANFGLTAGPDGPTPSDWAALAAAVPEPGSGMALVLGIGVLGSRRRRLLNG